MVTTNEERKEIIDYQTNSKLTLMESRHKFDIQKNEMKSTFEREKDVRREKIMDKLWGFKFDFLEKQQNPKRISK